MSKFSFRRRDKQAFRHIAHGLVPAATIAPRPAVPRTPPPRSPIPSPERPRSALAAAILSSSLIGQTVVVPPGRSRSFSESDCSQTRSTLEPYATTALYTSDRWTESLSHRPRLPSPERSVDESDEDEEGDMEQEELSDEEHSHVYQSLDRQRRSFSREDLYARPVNQVDQDLVQSEGEVMTDDSAIDKVSAQPAEEDEVPHLSVNKTHMSSALTSTPKLKQKPSSSSHRTIPSPDISKESVSTSKKRTRNSGIRSDGNSEDSGAYRDLLKMQQDQVRTLTKQNQVLGADKRSLEQRCTEQSVQMQQSLHRIQILEKKLSKSPDPTAGRPAELLNLRQQAQELVDENDSLKMTVHRLNVELSRYQTRFRPLSKEEISRIPGLPSKGAAPPWLLDMKYLSPLLLSYEDRLTEKESLLKALEDDLQKFRGHVEEVVQENERLHQELKQSGGVSHKEWRQLQEQAHLVLQENQVLIQQLEVQHAKAKDSHGRHLTEVSKLSKQLMLLEAEKLKLEQDLKDNKMELQTLQTENLQTRSHLKNSISLDKHHSITTKLKCQQEADSARQNSELEELHQRLSVLQAEKKSLVLDRTNLSTDIKALESDLEVSRHDNRKARRRMGLMKQQMEVSQEKEMTAHHYLASIISLAEKTRNERDQLVFMASSLEQDKQGVLTRVLEGTLRLGKLQEKIKVTISIFNNN
ncbi:hypothetical protein DPEC_G00193470 [Dallia pectoralis]|uniref:Uncharacterized protein n=1 Tax=Dallia pectoralis TaxID=75939 RepID=A0ACC2G6T3_DALPE|nr:hypothetical protein DPEC_G00193470 [Dallia pectoralis]